MEYSTLHDAWKRKMRRLGYKFDSDDTPEARKASQLSLAMALNAMARRSREAQA